MNRQWRDAIIYDAKKHYLAIQDINDAEVKIRYESEILGVPTAVIDDIVGLRSGDVSTARLRGFLAGISAALRLPPAKGFSFSDAVGSLLPRVVSQQFLTGYRLASGVSLFGLPLADGLVAVYVVEGDYVYSYLTQPRVEMWGVTDDRVSYAARSNLYHTTIRNEPVVFRMPVTHHRYQREDGFDSGRVLLLNDIFWNQVDAGIYFAVPSEDITLIVESCPPNELDLLKQDVVSLFEAAVHPVSPLLYYQEKKMIQVV
ncbi:MAG: hypothetical protein HUU55_05525 [Myxococcales bacterium]|nr:hypothetical protein [Myxococcales bacterium]